MCFYIWPLHPFHIQLRRNIPATSHSIAQKDEPEAVKLFIEALDDPFWKIREKAVDVVQVSAEDKSIINKIIDIAQNDPRSHVRAAAMEKIAEFNNTGLLVVAKDSLQPFVFCGYTFKVYVQRKKKLTLSFKI